ncbi:MAG: hypothetical protein ACR2HZ_02935 [Gemmatimonadaceae bacterium]
MDLFKKIRGVVTGTSGEDQEWIAVDGVGDTAELLRVIARTMPSGALLNIVKPRNAEVERFLQANKTGASNVEEGDYYISMSGSAVTQLAELVGYIGREPAFGAVLVTLDGGNLLEAYRRDSNEDVVWLSSSLASDMLSRAREGLNTIAENGAAASHTPALRARSA